MIVGECLNLATTVALDGPLVRRDRGRTYLAWNDEGLPKRLEIPAWFTANNEAYTRGRLEHLSLACQTGMRGSQDAIAYIQRLARRQIAAGAVHLDVTVDGLNRSPDELAAAMRWIVPLIQAAADSTPLLINSIFAGVMQSGLAVYDRARSTPMINGPMGKEPTRWAVAESSKLPFIWFIEGDCGMPHSVTDRMENLRALMSFAQAHGVALERIYFDVLVYPKVASARAGLDALDTFAAARAEFGPDLKLFGGITNIWFKNPLKRLVNLVFLELAIERGASGGILNPLTVHPRFLEKLDRSSAAYRRTREMLLSEDDNVVGTFLSDARAGLIEDPFANK